LVMEMWQRWYAMFTTRCRLYLYSPTIVILILDSIFYSATLS